MKFGLFGQLVILSFLKGEIQVSVAGTASGNSTTRCAARAGARQRTLGWGF